MDQNNKKIAVLGDGGWGTTLAILLSGKGHQVRLWGAFGDYVKYLQKKRENKKFLPSIRIPEEILISSQLNEVLDSVDMIVMAVPTQYSRKVLEKLKDFEPKDAIIVTVAKGIENKTLLKPTEIIAEVLGPDKKTAVLSGPSIAVEVAREMPAAVVASCTDHNAAEQVQAVFNTERFRVYTNNDPVGVELAGALKNIIAIACGISDGLGFGANTKAALLNRGLAEIKRLSVILGADPQTFNGLAGMGDLITTCISAYGRNRYVGQELAQGKKLTQILNEMDMVAEGVRTAESALELAKKHKVDMPITEQVCAVLFEDKNPLEAVKDLMLRDPKPEEKW
ncbi:MAG: NAD(P)-dependent glycerol-3-phosphate dehydrogenase [Candidatus Omnitrophica bacterium]|nr:NAD(P)-dependent glycerol-3-phosphate dehydrogenase [Candidatus Omnitrophota bacterium]